MDTQKKEKIQELIVVEGKNDTHRLKLFFDCDTIETGGDNLNAVTLERIKEAAKKRGIIVFTDPDSPGEHIRRQIKEAVPEAKHCFIEKKKARTDKKVGIEHASKEDLWQSLSHCVTFMEDTESLSWPAYIDLGLVGDKELRFFVCKAFHIGPCNAKTCFKRLNQMGIREEQIIEAVRKAGGYEATHRNRISD
jgi:ribonuclease M5